MLIVRDLSSLCFYFEAFLMLVVGKAYLISRAAVVPTTVRNDQELVEANSKLSLLSGVAAVVAAIPGGILLKLGGDTLGPQLVVGLAAIVFAIGAGFASQLPKVVVATEPPGAAEKLELKSAGIRLAASAMGLIRAAVGLLLLVLAFAFKAGDIELWFVGAAGLMAQAGVLAGAAARAPAAPGGVGAADHRRVAGRHVPRWLPRVVHRWDHRRRPAVVHPRDHLGYGEAGVRRARPARRPRRQPGRSFARFETRFQLAWVMGAFIPSCCRASGCRSPSTSATS